MTDIVVEVANGSSRVADIERIELPGVHMAPGSVQLLLKPMRDGDINKQSVQTQAFAAENHEFGGPLTFSTPIVTYRIDGVLWRRKGETGAPKRLEN